MAPGRRRKTPAASLAWPTGSSSRGYATLCFDKRGVGQSTGQYIPAIPQNSAAVFEDLSSDIAAGVEFLRSRPEIDRNRIGLAGVSQAGWIVPLAARKSNAAFMLVIVGPTVSYGLENFYSNIVEVTNAPVEEGYRQLPSFNGVHGFDPKPVLESIICSRPVAAGRRGSQHSDARHGGDPRSVDRVRKAVHARRLSWSRP